MRHATGLPCIMASVHMGIDASMRLSCDRLSSWVARRSIVDPEYLVLTDLQREVIHESSTDIQGGPPLVARDIRDSVRRPGQWRDQRRDGTAAPRQQPARGARRL